MKPLVFLCQPTHTHLVDARSHTAFELMATRGNCNVNWGGNRPGEGGSPMLGVTSLLCWNFNKMWAAALNLRATYRITHFAMLHSDIEPEPGWLDVLVAEQQRLGADVVSAVVPFKDQFARGITSTGLGRVDAPRGDCGVQGDSRRLTLHEIYQLPETFCAADTDSPNDVLLVNSGCWVADFTKPWVDARDVNGRARFSFQNHDGIVFDRDGKAHAECRGEDWTASYKLFDLGCKVYATRKIKTVHHGEFGYSNWVPGPDGKSTAWGQWKTDEEFQRLMQAKEAGELNGQLPAPVPVG